MAMRPAFPAMILTAVSLKFQNSNFKEEREGDSFAVNEEI
jgi:hypothetical protein